MVSAYSIGKAKRSKNLNKASEHYEW